MRKKRIVLIAGVALGLLLIFLLRKVVGEILTLLLSAAIQAYLLLPLIKKLEKRVPPTVATLLGFCIVLTVNLAFAIMLVPVFIQQIKEFARFLPEYLSTISESVKGYYNEIPMLQNIVDEISLGKNFFSKFSDYLDFLSPTTIVSAISTIFLVPVIMFYFLRDREKIKKMSLFVLPGEMRTPAIYMCRDINRQLRDYVFGQFVIILVVSGLMAAALGVFGFDYWLVLGLVMGIFNIIPYIGPIIGSVPVILVAATEGWDRIWLAIVLIVLVQQIDNIIIHPRIISESVKIHPVVVLLCVIAGSNIGSFIGMVLAIPVYIVLRILFKEFYKYFSERKQKISQFGKI